MLEGFYVGFSSVLEGVFAGCCVVFSCSYFVFVIY